MNRGVLVRSSQIAKKDGRFTYLKTMPVLLPMAIQINHRVAYLPREYQVCLRRR